MADAGRWRPYVQRQGQLLPAFAWLVHGERVGPATMAGGAIVLAAIAVKAIGERLRYSALVDAPKPAASRNRA